MAQYAYLTPLEMLYKWERERPAEIYLRQPINGTWHEWTWQQAGQEVRKMAAALQAMDLPPDTSIGLISKNCAHWLLADLAIMMAGHVSVPLYPNLHAATLQQILVHSNAKVLFVGKLDDWASMRSGLPDGVRGIAFPFYTEPGYETWDELVQGVKPMEGNIVRKPTDIATIIYTSGTTGMPKGVVHSFHNFAYVTSLAVDRVKLNYNDRFFSYLPLSHIAERVLVEMCGLYTGGTTSFAETLESFPKNLADSEPTVFLGVPRIWTKFQQGILKKLPQGRLAILLAIPVVNSLIRKKVKHGLGLGKATNILTGAAPTPTSLLRWFKRLGIHIQEAYGMTENVSYSHVTLNEKIKIGYVGAPMPGVEAKLGEDNEVLIRHDGMMLGYFKEPEMTKEMFLDGWLRTGDEGYIDPDGFLKITGRVKDLFKTDKGKYVAPSPIEMKMVANKDLDQVCVVGNHLPQPIALIVLSEFALAKTKEELVESLEETLDIVNGKLDHHEKLNKVVIMKEGWSVENELLTPTLKIKRNEVEKIHSGRYLDWYNRPERVIWE
ncbi:MAG: AMP-binding protein [Saprospirales bacterium]|nr:AMP-binding protein [Saprospirales bacterium]